MIMSKLLTLPLALFGLALVAGCDYGQASASSAASGENGPRANWQTDYEATLAAAAATGNKVLVQFTGSDWCPPCQALKRDVLDTEAFVSFANENLHLVELDFPRNIRQPASLVEQNRTLQEQYNIRGFPTLVLLDSEGNELDRKVGMMRGGVDAYLSWLRSS